MRHVTLAFAGMLAATVVASGTAAAERPGSLAPATRGSPRVSSGPPGSLFPVHRRMQPGISPHIGLPGISGFPQSNTEPRRHHGGHSGHGIGGYTGYWSDGDGYVDTIPMSDEPGFFATEGAVSFDGRHVTYHYDRSYPYEWYGGGPRQTRATASAALHCRVQNVRDEEQRKDVAVRVCAPY